MLSQGIRFILISGHQGMKKIYKYQMVILDLKVPICLKSKHED